MGRAVVKIADALVSVVLQHGMNAVDPLTPLKDVRVLGAKMEGYCVELLLESPDITGNDSKWWDAPSINVVMQRRTVVEGEAARQLVADHVRNAEGICECGKLGLANGYLCPRCRSLAALNRVPSTLLEEVRAEMRAAGDIVEEPTDDRRGEVPGA